MKTPGLRTSTAKSSWPGSGNRTPAPRNCSKTPITRRSSPASWKSWTPRTGSPWSTNAAISTTTSGRTRSTPRAFGAAPPGRATSPRIPSGMYCSTSMPLPLLKVLSGCSTVPVSSVLRTARSTALPWFRSPPTGATPTATASSTSKREPSWTRQQVASTFPQPKATSAGWMPTPFSCPAQLKACPPRRPPMHGPASSFAAGSR
ncbi:hypothetical protein PJL18_03752 [Paenarthrobacter nicotinovorans]|nr:hypothetical protein [Paenarthrobacter nicotinovorans]